jgi:hypothetical protein
MQWRVRPEPPNKELDTVINGRYAHFPRMCGSQSADAERWRGNLRVIVSCTAAGSASSGWLARVARALGRL